MTNEPLPILFEPRTATSVETMHITASYVRAGKPFLAVGPAFMAAHEALGIHLKYDGQINRGWVTAEEAAAIMEHMDEHL